MYYEIRDFKVSRQAVAVLAYLKGEWCAEDLPEGRPFCNTATWYNGREKGFSVTVYLPRYDSKELVIAFGEHRNSDEIFVDYWLRDIDINPPTVVEFTNEAYEQRRVFRYADMLGVTNHIKNLIEQYLAESVS